MRRTESIGGRGGTARGFTLVELITVMGILAILVTLVVSAFSGVSKPVADSATRQMLTTLTGALQRYYDDWGAFPWIADAAPMGKVDASINPFLDWTNDDKHKQAILYAALGMRQRNGPYMPAGAGQVLKKTHAGAPYLIYADGWGRPITYGPPVAPATVPRLTSQGSNEFDPSDDITN